MIESCTPLWAIQTAVMVTALAPQDFLGGMEECCDALGDVEIQLDAGVA